MLFKRLMLGSYLMPQKYLFLNYFIDLFDSIPVPKLVQTFETVSSYEYFNLNSLHN